MNRRSGRPSSVARLVVVVAAAALVFTACSRDRARDATGDPDRAATSTTVADDGRGTTPAATTPTSDAPAGAAADVGTPDKAKFCDATTVLITVPDDQTPQQYEAAVATGTATMVASVPDRSLVPLMRQMQQAYALYAQIATAEAAADPDGAARKVAEAETLFPPVDQKRLADYVKRECDIDI